MTSAYLLDPERGEHSDGPVLAAHNGHPLSTASDGTPRSGLRPLRILMIASEGPPTLSGMARTIQRLQDGLRAHHHQVDVVAYPDVRRASFGQIRISSLVLELPRIARQVDDYDVIHVHGAAPTVSDVLLAAARTWRKRKPTVYTHHCDIDVSWGGPLNTLYNSLHRRLAAGVDELVSTTRSYAAEVGLAGNTSVIPLGVDVGQVNRSGAKADQFTVLFVGQFRPYKGVPVLLRAMAKVHGGRLLVAGSGAEEHAYRELAAELGLDAEFVVGADDSELRRLYQRAHVLVLPSVTRAEAFGLVLLEGMAAGCVPVASDLPGVREVLGRVGFAFPPHSVDGLAAILRSLRDNPGLTRLVGSHARRRAAAFSWERTLADYERLFGVLVAVREFRHSLLDEATSQRLALRTFIRHVAADLGSEDAAIMLRGGGGQLQTVTRAAPSRTADDDRTEQVLGQYAAESGEGVLVTSDSVPSALAQQVGRPERSIMAAPLVVNGWPFGSVLVARTRAFDERDLESLTMLARHAAPPLHLWRGRELPTRGAPSVQAATGRGPSAAWGWPD